MNNRLISQLPVLRYRRFGGGYRRDDVEEALGRLVSTVGAVESALEELRSHSHELEAELRDRDRELAAFRSREEQLDAALRRVEDVLARVNGKATQ